MIAASLDALLEREDDLVNPRIQFSVSRAAS